MASKNVWLTDCHTNVGHKFSKTDQNTTEMNKRRSFDAEDVERVKRDKELADLISEKVEVRLQESKNEFLKTLKEKDDAILLLRNELDSKLVGSRCESIKSTAKKASERTDTMKGKGFPRSASCRVVTRNVQVSRSLFNNDKQHRNGHKMNGNVAKDEPQSEETVETNSNTAHLRRLTDEHAKLQAEYARIRTILQTARIQLPVGRNPAEMAVIESESSLSRGDDDDSEKAAIRREVLRLKEELLAMHQRMNLHLEAKNSSLEEMQQFRRDSQLKDVEIQRLEAEKSDFERQLQRIGVKLAEIRGSRDALQAKLKETEKEGIEIKEFLQEEHQSLSEGLREAEERSTEHKKTIDELSLALHSKEEHCEVLSQVVEKAQAQVALLTTELKDVQDGARHLLLKQEAELGSCAAVVRELRVYVEYLNAGHSMSMPAQKILKTAENDGEVVIEQMDEDETIASQIAAVRRNVERMLTKLNCYVSSLEKANIERNTFEENLNVANARLKEMEIKLESNIAEMQRIEKANKRLKRFADDTLERLEKNWANVTEAADEKLEIRDLTVALTKAQKCISQLRVENTDLTKQVDEIVATVASTDKTAQKLKEYTTICRQVSSLRNHLVEKDQEVEDVAAKYERHSKILRDNLGKAEAEIQRLDAVIDHILMTFTKVGDVVRTNADLKQLWDDLDGKEFVVTRSQQFESAFAFDRLSDLDGNDFAKDAENEQRVATQPITCSRRFESTGARMIKKKKHSSV